ncbi:hypothetical protein LUZ60_010393 [Juncus effusus]|nr:hypothetical protein LUZ60_010393 [Juncus effusus]
MNPSHLSLFLFSFSFFFLLSPTHAQQTLANSTELFALYTLRSSLAIRARYWPLKSDPCTAWAGISCLSGRVTSVSLTGLRRTRLGRLNPHFSVEALQNLSSLTTFNASGFYLPGSIPAWFGTRFGSGLRILDLGLTGVNGSVPAELGLLSNLQSLILSHNELTGTIPVQLGNLTSLQFLDLGFNNLSGSVPDSIWKLPEAKYVDLSSNQLTGQLPDLLPIRNFTSGLVFNLSSNLFYGSISSVFGSLKKNFNVLDLSNNYFEGSLNLSANGNASVLISTNCLDNLTNQRNLSDCEDFYKQRGLKYDKITILPPESSPASPPSPLVHSFGAKIKKSKSKKSKYVLGGAFGGLGVIIILITLLIIFCVFRRKERRTRPVSRRGSSVNAVQSSPVAHALASPVKTPSDPLNFDQLALATSAFSDDKCLKKGHNGYVYNGLLQDGAHVAVKRVKRVDVNTTKKEGYLGELGFYSKFSQSHARFVPLLGHYVKDENEEFLVYKFMSKGDLTSALHKKENDNNEGRNELEGLPSLDWITRLKIATGVAEAICFLHHECNPPLVHRDIQASSILLDDKFEVRLGSLSEICVQQGDGHYSVFSRILRSSKSLDKVISGPPAMCSYDIFCFGKVLLELVTGKLGLSGSDNASTLDFIETALNHITITDRDQITKIIDPSLFLYEDHLEEVWATGIIAKSCLNARPSKRPPARQVLKALENPLKIVREEERAHSNRLRSMSSRSSWHFGSDFNSSISARVLEARSFRHSVKSQGSEKSISHNKRSFREVVPERNDLEGEIEITP